MKFKVWKENKLYTCELIIWFDAKNTMLAKWSTHTIF